MGSYPAVLAALRSAPRRWVVTGGAGFIGSHLVETLLRNGQHVTVLDDFSTGHRSNLDEVRAAAGPDAAARLQVIEGDIRDAEACLRAFRGAHRVLHQAALGSVPRSIEQPIASHAVNVTGFLNVLEAARSEGIARVVYASSSSVYGDSPASPKKEEDVGRQLSPYAASKYCDEVYATAFGSCYPLQLVGLRYFNVFGARQDPRGVYAAVVPRWFAALLRGEAVEIYGDGLTSRDFCYVENAVQANLLAATTDLPEALGRVYNVAFGATTSLNDLFGLIREQVAKIRPEAAAAEPVYRDFRRGDIRHSLADVGRARALLGYAPAHSVADGLAEAVTWYQGLASRR
jgi:UDP-N-acetylglucosamine 4-epimerase